MSRHAQQLVAAVAALWVAAAACSALDLDAGQQYFERFSEVPWQEWPGGRFKASTSATLGASTIAGALFDLEPGGLRELHWHDAAEWAMVVEGTCMAMAVDEGRTHPSDSWNFSSGDVWYFPANVPHSILGMRPRGCTFVSGYNSGGFSELESFSASSWLSTVPAEALAQALGMTLAAAKQIRDASKGGRPSFLPRADLDVVLGGRPPLPPQTPRLIHRFSLSQNIPEVVNADGSFVDMVDVTRFPVSKEMSGALVRIAPGGMRQLHWHLNFDEWQYVINGTVEAGVFLRPGRSAAAALRAGDLGFAPRGAGHYLRNAGGGPAHVVLIFNAGLFTNVDVGSFLGAAPPALAAASLGVPLATAEALDCTLAGFAPSQGTQGEGAAAGAAGAAAL